jgi:hypothetical protein
LALITSGSLEIPTGALLALSHKHADNRETIAKLIVAKLTSRIAMGQTLGGAVRVLYSVSKLSSGNQVVCLMAPLIGPSITSKCP